MVPFDDVIMLTGQACKLYITFWIVKLLACISLMLKHATHPKKRWVQMSTTMIWLLMTPFNNRLFLGKIIYEYIHSERVWNEKKWLQFCEAELLKNYWFITRWHVLTNNYMIIGNTCIEWNLAARNAPIPLSVWALGPIAKGIRSFHLHNLHNGNYYGQDNTLEQTLELWKTSKNLRSI